MPVTTAQEAIVQGEAEYAALLAMLRTLTSADWSRGTDCPAWTVRDIVAHVTGAAEEAVRRRVQLRHLLVAQTRDRQRPTADSLSAQQVADREGHAPDQLVSELQKLAQAAPRGRAGTPGFLRRRPMPADAGCLPGDTIGYLVDTIYNRDLWMHRIDIARATGCHLVPSDAEPAIVGQVARDLSRAWAGTPFNLTLTGRVRGSWRIGEGHGGGGDADTAEVTVNAVALCRLLSGRSDETEPALHGSEPDLVEALRNSRVLF